MLTELVCLAVLALLVGCTILSFVAGWWARGQTIDLDHNDADLLREALDAVEAGQVIRIER